MSAIISSYLADGGSDYIESGEYERRRFALAEKMAAGPVSLKDMADTLGLPVAVTAALWNAWQANAEATKATKH